MNAFPNLACFHALIVYPQLYNLAGRSANVDVQFTNLDPNRPWTIFRSGSTSGLPAVSEPTSSVLFPAGCNSANGQGVHFWIQIAAHCTIELACGVCQNERIRRKRFLQRASEFRTRNCAMASFAGIALITSKSTPALKALVLGLGVDVLLHLNSAIAIDIVDASQPASDPQPRYNVPGGPKIGRYIDRPDSFFLSPDGKQFVDNLVGWQNPNGGWFKNFSYVSPRPAILEDNPNSGPPGDDDQVWHQVSTFDNGATYSEMRVLSRLSGVEGSEISGII